MAEPLITAHDDASHSKTAENSRKQQNVQGEA
jgi:hypothetical protein